jgi:hypothetical protein
MDPGELAGADRRKRRDLANAGTGSLKNSRNVNSWNVMIGSVSPEG